MNRKTIQAIITATLAAGSTSSPYRYDVNITQQLCQPACADETPVFLPSFRLIGVENIGTSHYKASIHVEGVISYIPCGCSSCNTKSQTISQDFSISFISTAAPASVVVTAGETANAIAKNACCDCSKTFVSETPLSVAVTTA